MPKPTFAAAAEGMPNISRRSMLGGILPVALAAPLTLQMAQPASAAAWQGVIASLDGIIPQGARVQIFGSATRCRVEFLQTFMEPVSPKLPGVTMPVEWTVGSYELTERGWVSERIYEGRFE